MAAWILHEAAGHTSPQLIKAAAHLLHRLVMASCRVLAVMPAHNTAAAKWVYLVWSCAKAGQATPCTAAPPQSPTHQSVGPASHRTGWRWPAGGCWAGSRRCSSAGAPGAHTGSCSSPAPSSESSRPACRPAAGRSRFEAWRIVAASCSKCRPAAAGPGRWSSHPHHCEGKLQA